MTDLPARPPEAELLRRARQLRRLSIRQAAIEISASMPPGESISESRLRQIEAGYQTVSKGVQIATSAPSPTLAFIARFYGIAPGDLRDAQREDAADVLREMEHQSQAPAPLASLTSEPAVSDPESVAETEFMNWLLGSGPRDRPLLTAIARLTDPENRPYPWSHKLSIARDHLSPGNGAARDGETGTALSPALVPQLQEKFHVW